MDQTTIEPTDRSTARRLAWCAAIAVLLFAVAFGLLVCTPIGQRLGNYALGGRLLAPQSLRKRSDEALRTMTHTSLFLLGGGLVLIALARGRVRLAGAIAVSILVSVLGAEALKSVLPRPDFGLDRPHLAFNTAPSGHAAIATVLTLCAVMVSPRRLRRPVAVVGWIYMALVAAATMAAGWHRPDDVILGELLSLAVCAAVCAVLVAWRGGSRPVADQQINLVRQIPALILLAVLPFAVLQGLTIGREQIVWTRRGVAFLLSAGLLDIAGLVVVAVFVWLLGGITLDPPLIDRAGASVGDDDDVAGTVGLA